MYFGIYGEKEVDDITLSGNNSILIRILDKNHSFQLKTCSFYNKVLNLKISDIPLDLVDDNFRCELNNSFFELNKFILENDFDEVIVHCSAGISRSPAIMICIAKMLGSIEMESIVKDSFLYFNKAIVNEFNNYNFVKKDVMLDDVIFKGHFINGNENYLDSLLLDCDKKVYKKIKR